MHHAAMLSRRAAQARVHLHDADAQRVARGAVDFGGGEYPAHQRLGDGLRLVLHLLGGAAEVALVAAQPCLLLGTSLVNGLRSRKGRSAGRLRCGHVRTGRCELEAARAATASGSVMSLKEAILIISWQVGVGAGGALNCSGRRCKLVAMLIP